MHIVVLVFVMASFNSLSFSPVMGCDDKLSTMPHIRFPSDIVGQGELMETNLNNRKVDPLDVSHLPLHTEHFNVMGENFDEVRECQHGEGCQKQATFANVDNNVPTFCVKHALRGSVFVKRGYCR
jgi:hypothetical protein